MGSITPYETANGKRYRVRYRKPDRAQTDERGFSTKRAAELFLASVEVSKARGEYVDAIAGRATIGELGGDWIRHQDHLKASSALPLEIALRLHVMPRWSRVPVSDVRFTDVQTSVSGINGGSTKVIRAYGGLASILDCRRRSRSTHPDQPGKGRQSAPERSKRTAVPVTSATSSPRPSLRQPSDAHPASRLHRT